MCKGSCWFRGEEESRKIEIEDSYIRRGNILLAKLSCSPTMELGNCVDSLNRLESAVSETRTETHLAFARGTCQIAALVRGIIGLRDNFESRTRIRRYTLPTGRPSAPERVQGVISFGTIKGPTTLNPGGHPWPAAERSRNTIPA